MDPRKHRPRPFSSAIVEAIRDSIVSDLEANIEATIRRVFREEMELAFSKLFITTGAPPKQISRPPPTRQLRLQFTGNPPSDIFADVKMEEQCDQNLGVQLLDADGQLVTTGLESAAKLDVVALMGDFDIPEEEDWSAEEFGRHVQRERGGRRPLLLGDLKVTLKEGVGTVGSISFTDNSSWTRSKKFRLGVKVSVNEWGEAHIREAKTQSFTVKDRRGIAYKKRYPPRPQDDVWRLENIHRGGQYHKRLKENGICTVQQFCDSLVAMPGELRQVLGMSMPQKQYDATVRHAKQCKEIAGNHGIQPDNANEHVNYELLQGFKMGAEGCWNTHNYTKPVQAEGEFPGQANHIFMGMPGGNMDYNGRGFASRQEVGQGHVCSKSASRWLKISMVFRCTISMKTAGAAYRQRKAMDLESIDEYLMMVENADIDG